MRCGCDNDCPGRIAHEGQMFCNPITEGEAGVVSGFGDRLPVRALRGWARLPTILIASGNAPLSWRVKIPVPEPTSTTRLEAQPREM